MSETDNIFVYRDAKQFTGLSHCQARDNHKLDFAYNASFAAVNVAKSHRRGLDSGLSIGRMKSLLGSMKYFGGGCTNSDKYFTNLVRCKLQCAITLCSEHYRSVNIFFQNTIIQNTIFKSYEISKFCCVLRCVVLSFCFY